MTRWFLIVASLLPCAAAAQSAPAASMTFRGLVEAIDGTNGLVYVESAQQDPRSLPRVRSHDPRIVDAIARGTAASPTLRRLIDTIDATDGIVYLDDGKCGYIVRACLLLLVQIAGPSRLLRIQVNLREVRGCELIGVIGHELQHATELLADPRIRTDIQAYNFFAVGRLRPEARRFDTKAAQQMADTISREACGG